MDANVSASTKTCSCVLIIAALLGAFIILPEACLADRGGWHVHTEAVTLKESGQRAIIGWDGQTEVLCLGTDVSSSKKTTVIEFLPLPSEPNVTLGSRETFEAVERVLARRGVRFYKEKLISGKVLRAGGDEGEAFRVTFHQRLGSHDVTVVKVNRPDEFVDWVEEKARVLTQNQASVPDGLRKLIAKYLDEYRCPYFVFDVIEVGPDPRSVEPIIYEFKSPLLFYPLEISSTFHGQTTIDLIVFSEGRINPDPFWRLGFQVSSLGSVSGPDMRRVLPRLKELLGETAVVQAFRYTGDIRGLKGNIAVGPRQDSLAFTRQEYSRAKSRSFYSGIAAGIIGGVLIAFASLFPMYFAAKRQRPRWGLRLLAGFLLGMPVSFGLIVGGAAIVRELGLWAYFLQIDAPIRFIMCSMGMGFIIFCFQLGLRRGWYLWGLVYAALAVPASFIDAPEGVEGLLWGNWHGLWEDVQPALVDYLLLFVSLFLIARFVIWITSLWKRERIVKN